MDRFSDAERNRRAKRNTQRTAAVLVAASGLVLAAAGFLMPQTVSSTAGQAVIAYTMLNMLLSLSGGFLFATGIYALVGKAGERPVEEHIMPETQTIASPDVSAPVSTTDVQPGNGLQLEEEPSGDMGSTSATATEPGPMETPVGTALGGEIGAKEDGRLVLRLLSGDERTVFRTIMEAGGETIQKDIVNKTKMSDAKVSRTLDRLVDRGVIVKERHGMSNKVRIEVER